MNARLRTLLCGGLLTCLLAALSCDEPKKTAPVVTQTAAPSGAETPTVSAPPAPPRMPEVTIDTSHVQIGFDELKLGVPSYQDLLKAMIAKVPVAQPERVVLNAARTNKLPDVTNLVYALFDSGARGIEVRTTPRGSFPGKIVITPEKAIGAKAQPCSYTGMVLKDLGVTFWHLKGGLAKRYSKGMAGPDFTMMHDSLSKEIDNCSSTVFFFSGEDTGEWGHVFDLATSVSSHEPKYRTDTFVLLREIPVPGKPVKISS